jgi:hypothetical protein
LLLIAQIPTVSPWKIVFSEGGEHGECQNG